MEGNLERLTRRASRERIRMEIGGEEEQVPAGSPALRLSKVPPSPSMARRLESFPVRWGPRGFVFDGRAYRGVADAISLKAPESRETIVLGNGSEAILRLAARRLFEGEDDASHYRLVSGDFSKSGRFARSSGGLSIDRGSDRDQIGEREEFLRALRRERRGGADWLFRDSERDAVERWEPVLRRYAGAFPPAGLSIRIFPDAALKARMTGSSRPADWSRQGSGIRVDVDRSAPAEPDLVSPVLASAVSGSRDARLLERPMLLAALGARSAGSWWGRDARGFAAFARAAGVEPSVAAVLRSDAAVSPVLGVGAAASWVDAGIASEGEAAVRRSLAGDAVAAALERWRAASHRISPASPRRRGIPAGFLRGVSYAMANSIDGSYAAPESRRTLERLSRFLSANSISVMPFGFSADPVRPGIEFIHRHPRGETDEGTVRAVSDGRALGMTSLVKPQLWVGRGAFVGEIAMRSDADWKSWFAAYRQFVVHHAVVAQAAGADLFCVGTELVATEGRVREWRETIAAVRLATGAPLLYASNWAAGAGRVPFWDGLDLIGADFYDPLSTKSQTSDAELEAGARRAAEPLAHLARRTGKAVVLTEAGYPPVEGAWIAPHDETTSRPPAPGDSARAVSAVFRALEREPWWKGVYWWKAFSDGRPARPGERGFNFVGTPAEGAIAVGFARMAARRGPGS